MHRYLIILMLGLYACAGPVENQTQTQTDTTMEVQIKAIEKALSDKFDEAFTVDDVGFDRGLNMYVYEAFPKKNADCRFRGQFDETEPDHPSQLVNDSYTNESLAYEAKEKLSSLVKKLSEPCVYDFTIVSRLDHSFGEKVADLKAFMSDRPEKSTVRMNLYLFTLPSNRDDDNVEGLTKLADKLNSTFGNNVALYTGFWSEDFLDSKDFDSLTWGFESTDMTDADNLVAVMKGLKKVLFIKMETDEAEDLNSNQIFGLIEDHKKSGMNKMHKI